MKNWEHVIGFRKGTFNVHLYIKEYEVDNDRFKVKTWTASWEKEQEFTDQTKAVAYYEEEIKWIKSLLADVRMTMNETLESQWGLDKRDSL